MLTEEERKEYAETVESFERMQQFDVNSLVRNELGVDFNFQDVVEPANRLIMLYKQLSVSTFNDFPIEHVRNLKNRANSDYNLFTQIIQFQTKQK
jgi:hypothetical protein